MPETKIENHAHDSSTINNAESIIFNMFDNMLKYYLDREITRDKNFEPIANVVNYIVNKEALKKKFCGNTYMYEELIDVLKNKKIVNCNFDDGYKSVIYCISTIAHMFTLNYKEISSNNEEETESCFLLLNNQQEIQAIIIEYKLQFYIADSVRDYKKYTELTEKIKKMMQKINEILECTSQYGNYLVFSSSGKENNEDLPFIDQDVRFKVSNDVIPNLIKPLYGESPECGLREIIQNACDACKQRILTLENPEDKKKCIVEVYLNKREEKWELVVRDFGIGMDENTILNKYFVVGESSKRSLEEMDAVGQFGIGALAAFLLGDIIEVKTYAGVKNKVYHFRYKCETDYSIEIKKENSIKFEQGTEVKILLDIKEDEADSIERKLKIFDWYRMSDIKINYYLNDDAKEFPSYAEKEWKVIDEYDGKNDIYASLLDCSNENNEIANNIYYNGIAVPTPYKFEEPFNNLSMPCINLKVRNRKIQLKLDRSDFNDESKITINRILDKVKTIVYQKVLDKLKEDKESIVFNNKIIKFTYYNAYIRRIRLKFSNRGFSLGIPTEFDYYKKMEINGINSGINTDKLLPEFMYSFNQSENKKSDIAKIVEKYTVTVIPKKYLQWYFYKAENQYTGFKWDLMKEIYNALHIECPNKSAINENWAIHNKIKSEIECPENIIIKSYHLNLEQEEIINKTIKEFPGSIIGIDFIERSVDDKRYIPYRDYLTTE